MADNVSIITDFIKAWSNLDSDELVSYFTVDGVYHNMPTQPISGEENLKQFISGFISIWDSTEWEIINLMASGDLVIVERIDRTKMGDRSVNLPCVGVFEMQEGKIKIWRDYFDMNTYVGALT